MLARFLLSVALATIATSSYAFDVAPDNATAVLSDTSPADDVRLPNSVWTSDKEVPVVQGQVRRTVYQRPGGTPTTLQFLTPMQERLEAEGYDIVFTCSDRVCGGFEFRFQLDLLGEPEMHVDLGDFRYLLARKRGATVDPFAVSIVVSRDANTSFAHITEVFGAEALPEAVEAVPTTEIEATNTTPLIERLLTTGREVLTDLDFGSGSADLGDGPFVSLSALAGWLAENPNARIILVGHTDAVGSLENNTALSKRRAESVLVRLRDGFSVSDVQLSAEGAGYLSPRASNLSDDGRSLNRRVEVVLLSLE